MNLCFSVFPWRCPFEIIVNHFNFTVVPTTRWKRGNSAYLFINLQFQMSHAPTYIIINLLTFSSFECITQKLNFECHSFCWKSLLIIFKSGFFVRWYCEQHRLIVKMWARLWSVRFSLVIIVGILVLDLRFIEKFVVDVIGFREIRFTFKITIDVTRCNPVIRIGILQVGVVLVDCCTSITPNSRSSSSHDHNLEIEAEPCVFNVLCNGSRASNFYIFSRLRT